MSEQGKRYKAIFEGLPLALVIVDPQSEIIADANPAALYIVDRQFTVALGKYRQRIAIRLQVRGHEETLSIIQWLVEL